MENVNLAKMIYHCWMSNMKFTLDIEEQKYEHGRNDSRFRFFKKMLMKNTYDSMRALFKDLHKLGLIEPTDYSEDVKDGYKETPSGGSGYVNTPSFDDWLNKS